MMVLVLHKEIESKVNKLRHMRLDFMHTNQKKKEFEKSHMPDQSRW